MLSKSRFLKTTVLAALAGLAAAVAVTPASARDFDRSGGYERDRDSGRGHDSDRDGYRGDHRGRDDHGHRHHHHNHRGWY